MKIKLSMNILSSMLVFISLTTFNVSASDSLKAIKNFHFVSDKLASSGMLELSDYKYIHNYGFKHVINLIPGMQIKEKKYVLSLGMSYQQIPVSWDSPTLEDFQQFVTLMKSYGKDKIFVHCQLNWRAASFIYLYRVTQLGESVQQAKRDLEAVWAPHDGWDDYIEKILNVYQNPL